ncbi:arsenate reductase family protein [Pontimicrobium sp. MEBiC01747]
MIKIYHNNRCSKSRCGLEIVKDSGKDYEVINYLVDTPTVEDVKNLLSLLNIEPLALIRKNEAIWKADYKGKDLTNEDIIKAMVAHPKLIERPIVINGDKAVIGRPPELITTII